MAVDYSSKETNDIHNLENYASEIIAALTSGNPTTILDYINQAVTNAVNNTTEGDYSNWTLQWTKNVANDWSGAIDPTQIQYNEDIHILLLYDEGSICRAIVSLTNGTINGTIVALKSGGGATFSTPFSVFGKYYIEVVDVGTNYNLNIYKNEALLRTINLDTELGIECSGYYYLAMSTDGKYFVVSGSGLVALYKGT